MRLGVVILPAGICGKVEGFGDGRTGGTAEPEPEGFDANSPGPPVDPRFCETGQGRSAGFDCLLVTGGKTNGLGFRATAARFVGPLGRWNTIDLRDSPRGSPRRARNRTDHT